MTLFYINCQNGQNRVHDEKLVIILGEPYVGGGGDSVEWTLVKSNLKSLRIFIFWGVGGGGGGALWSELRSCQIWSLWEFHFRGGGGGGKRLSGVKFQRGALWRIWTQNIPTQFIASLASHCMTDSLRHTTYMETNDSKMEDKIILLFISILNTQSIRFSQIFLQATLKWAAIKKIHLFNHKKYISGHFVVVIL